MYVVQRSCWVGSSTPSSDPEASGSRGYLLPAIGRGEPQAPPVTI